MAATATGLTGTAPSLMDAVQCHAGTFLSTLANVLCRSRNRAGVFQRSDIGEGVHSLECTIEDPRDNVHRSTPLSGTLTPTALTCQGLRESLSVLLSPDGFALEGIVRRAHEAVDFSHGDIRNCVSNLSSVPEAEQSDAEQEHPCAECSECWEPEAPHIPPAFIMDAFGGDNDGLWSEFPPAPENFFDTYQATGHEGMMDVLLRTDAPTSFEVPPMFWDVSDGTQTDEASRTPGWSHTHTDSSSVVPQLSGELSGWDVLFGDATSHCNLAPQSACFGVETETSTVECVPHRTVDETRGAGRPAQTLYSSDPADVYFELMGLC